MNNMETITQWSLMASSVIIIVALLRWTLKGQMKKTWQYGLWLIVIIRLLIPQLPSSKLSVFNLLPSLSNLFSVNTAVVENESRLKNLGVEWVQEEVTQEAVTQEVEGKVERSTHMPNQEVDKTHLFTQILYIVWIMGIISVLLYFSCGYYNLSQKLKKTKTIKDDTVAQMAEALKVRLNIQKDIRLVEGNHPMIFGILRPTIVIPTEYKASEIEVMMLHELVHYKYKDNIMTYIQILALAIHWFNPLVWLAMRWMKQDMEFACDERVLVLGADKKYYASVLLNSAINHQTNTYLVHGMGEDANQTRKRILQMAYFKKPKVWVSIVIGIVLIGIVFLCLTNPIEEDVTNVTEPSVNEEGHGAVPVEEGVKNIAVFGMDKDGYRADTVIVVSLDSKTGKTKVISIPRDTKVIWDDEQKKVKTSYIPEVSKLSEMTAYGGLENIRELTVKQVETILGAPIDNYVILELDIVRKVIDTVGGLEVEVPKDMYYRDTAQSLAIDLKKGKQLLDGEQIEGLIRFRHYPAGDIERIKTQKMVVEAFIKKAMETLNIIKVLELAQTLYETVQTDINPNELMQYYNDSIKIDLNKLEFYTVPGEGRYEEGISYYILDDIGSKVIIQ